MKIFCKGSLFQVLEVGHNKASPGRDEAVENKGRVGDNFTPLHLTFRFSSQGMTAEKSTGE